MLFDALEILRLLKQIFFILLLLLDVVAFILEKLEDGLRSGLLSLDYGSMGDVLVLTENFCVAHWVKLLFKYLLKFIFIFNF